MDRAAAIAQVESTWETSIVPELERYIAIPNKSPAFDPDWSEHGHMERAVELIETWCKAREIDGLTVEVVRLEGRTPLIYMEIPARGDARGDAAASTVQEVVLHIADQPPACC